MQAKHYCEDRNSRLVGITSDDLILILDTALQKIQNYGWPFIGDITLTGIKKQRVRVENIN